MMRLIKENVRLSWFCAGWHLRGISLWRSGGDATAVTLLPPLAVIGVASAKHRPRLRIPLIPFPSVQSNHDGMAGVLVVFLGQQWMVAAWSYRITLLAHCRCCCLQVRAPPVLGWKRTVGLPNRTMHTRDNKPHMSELKTNHV